MKFIVSRDEIYRNLSMISGVLSTNNVMPILDNFLFTVAGDTLTVTASDLDTTMSAVIQLSNTEGEGSVAVPSKILLATLKELPSTPIVFAIDEETHFMQFTASACDGEYDSPCIDGAEFPQLPIIQNPSAFDIQAPVLYRAISKTLFATGNDELRPNMMGVLCELSADNVTFVATDAHKMVRYRNSSIHANDFVSFILPKKPLTQLKSVLGGLGDGVHVEYSEDTHHVQFTFANITLFSSLKEGKFPNYETVIPKDNANVLTVSTGDFLKAVKRVLNFSNKSTFQIRMILSETGITIKAEDIDFSSRAEEIVNGNYKGEEMSIGFNAKFLCEMVDNMDSDEIRIEMSVPSRAVLILPDQEFDASENLLMLIMPVMLNEE
jgi:DNA polymerase-3 subunit beta